MFLSFRILTSKFDIGKFIPAFKQICAEVAELSDLDDDTSDSMVSKIQAIMEK